MSFSARGAAAWLPLLIVVLGLQACGGGGGGDPAPSNPPVTTGPPPPPAPTALTYTSPQSYTVGTAITPLDPTVTGTVTSYSVSPSYAPGGTGTTITISELVLNATTGLWVRDAKFTVPHLDGNVLATKENTVFVAHAGNTCIGVVRATAAPSRYIVKS